MRALLPAPKADVDVDVEADVDLHTFYGANWLVPGGVRVNFVSSVDGAAAAGGLSRNLQTPGDNRVFAALRDLADVVLAGAGTVRDESYGPAKLTSKRLDLRREHGLSGELPVAIVTRSLNLDLNSSLFTDSRPIVITSASASSDRRRAIEAVADVLVCGDDSIDLTLARATLADRGLTRVLCEGGPSLFADLLRSGVADELCLSISPLLSGPGAPRIAGGNELPEPVGLELAGLLEEDGALFCRYRVVRQRRNKIVASEAAA